MSKMSFCFATWSTTKIDLLCEDYARYRHRDCIASNWWSHWSNQWCQIFFVSLLFISKETFLWRHYAKLSLERDKMFTFWMEKKLIKTDKNCPFWRVFENLKLAVKQCYQTGQFNRTKIGGKCQNSKIQMRDILSNFQTMCIAAWRLKWFSPVNIFTWFLSE